MVLELLTILLVIDCLFIIIGLLIKDKYRKISTVLSIIGVIFLIVSILLFYIAMSEVTSVGVGSFSGGGNLTVSVPGLQENANIDCNWGPSGGLFFSILALVSMVALSILSFFNKLLERLDIRLT
jgi:hypothetical protein